MQQKGKTSRVKEDGTTPISVATNVVFITSQYDQSLQSREDLKPSNWPTLSKTEVSDRISKLEEELNLNFRSFPYDKQIKKMNSVSKETKLSLKNHSMDLDSVDIQMKSNKNVCPDCKYENDSSRDCASCLENFSNIPDKSTLYGDVPDGHPSQIPTISIGEIIDVNPNAYVTVKTCFNDTSEQVGIGKEREWYPMGFDGVPYRIGAQIIENTVTCLDCLDEIELSENYNFENHIDECHPENSNVKSTPTFGHILLVPGAGHCEKNMLLALFRMCKPIFLDEVSHKLGFISKNAKEFISNCGDHHLSWQILDICYEALGKELVHSYFVECIKYNRTASVNDFVVWRTEAKNANIQFYYDLTFNIMLGLKCYRSGIRRNNSLYSLSGREKVAPLRR